LKGFGLKGFGLKGFGLSFPDQQPDGDDTPGVAAAPVALAAGIMPGAPR
jgi:hypothetical protein